VNQKLSHGAADAGVEPVISPIALMAVSIAANRALHLFVVDMVLFLLCLWVGDVLSDHLVVPTSLLWRDQGRSVVGY
jgi:hypothetical protein